MSKKYKRKPCVYCATAPSVTADHVVAREFFLPERREHIPKVPACLECNNRKSKLEHYLASLLPFGGRHGDAHINLTQMIPKRLHKNRKLHLKLAEGYRRTWVQETSGLALQTAALPVDGDRLLALFKLITKGLLWHHWGVTLTERHFVEAIALSSAGDRYFDQLLSLRAANRVEGDLGAGTFRYLGAQGSDYPETTVWVFSIYNGVKFTEKLSDFADSSNRFGAFTGRRAVLERIQARQTGHNLTMP